MASAVNYAVRESVALITINNPPVNALSYAVRSGLVSQIKRALGDQSVKAVVITGEGKTFPAGADITEFNKGMKEPFLPEVIDVIEQSTKPVVAAIHGTGLGGGLEVALGCHYRVMDKTAKVGLPEVHLGILPGAGGTQRLPRLIGVQKALEMIVSGSPIRASDALKLGLADKVVDENLMETAISFAKEVAGKDVQERRISGMQSKVSGDFGPLFSTFRKEAAKMYRNFNAPQRCIDAVEGATKGTFREGMQRENQLIMDCMKGEQAKAQQYVFFAEREVARIPGLDPKLAKPIKSVGIIGAGTMGGGIAMNFANAGIPVTLLETKQDFLDRGLATVAKNYKIQVQKGRLTQEAMDKRMALLRPTLDYNALSDADMVIEAVFENMDVKRQVFGKLDQVCKPEAILCSNTSTLSIDEIAAATSRPDKVIGAHFFSPANVMKLLENVKGAKSSPSTIATVMQLSKTINKVGVLVGNCEGFVGNRMLEWYGVEAGFLLEEGALPQQVDKVIYDFGFPMGPFTMGDLAGLDVGWRIRQGKGLTDPATRPKDRRYCELGDRLCEQNRFGQKTGAGWYKYEAGSRTPVPDPAIENFILEHSASKGIARRVISDQEILERCMYPLINEGFKILEEGIALRPGDVDIIWLYGYGFPRYRGGPMHYADVIGLKNLCAALHKYSQAHPNSPHFKPARLLEELAS
eukprot:Colp12_sorted_trinity150504_noHs@4229